MSKTTEENRKKTLIVYSLFGALLVGFCIYAYEELFADNAPPPQTQAPVIVNKSNPVAAAKNQAAGGAQTGGSGVAAGVPATKMASTSSSLDPTLDETAMLRTENLIYAGNGRNIFSVVAYVAPLAIPKNLPPARPVETAPVAVAPVGPPPPPPIDLKYFGTELESNGKRQAFLLHGEDVYLAAQGDIVARRYKIVSISASSVQVEDLSNANTQTLQLQAN